MAITDQEQPVHRWLLGFAASMLSAAVAGMIVGLALLRAVAEQ